MPKTFADGRCSATDADELSAFFAPRIKDLVGGDRGLGQTLETIRQCASLREHVGPRALAGWIETHETPFARECARRGIGEGGRSALRKDRRPAGRAPSPQGAKRQRQGRAESLPRVNGATAC